MLRIGEIDIGRDAIWQYLSGDDAHTCVIGLLSKHHQYSILPMSPRLTIHTGRDTGSRVEVEKSNSPFYFC
jgi:hypothetical protein